MMLVNVMVMNDCLVVTGTWLDYVPFHIWDIPSHWRTPSFFKMLKTCRFAPPTSVVHPTTLHSKSCLDPCATWSHGTGGFNILCNHIWDDFPQWRVWRILFVCRTTNQVNLYSMGVGLEYLQYLAVQRMVSRWILTRRRAPATGHGPQMMRWISLSDLPRLKKHEEITSSPNLVNMKHLWTMYPLVN